MTTFSMRLSHEELQQLKDKAVDNGFNSLSTYLKYVGMNSKVVATVPKVGTVKKKKCGQCQQLKSYDEFYKDNSNKTDGLQGHCKDCRKEYNSK